MDKKNWNYVKTPAVLLKHSEMKTKSFQWCYSLLLSAFMTLIDYEACCFLSVYSNYYRLTLSLLHQHRTVLRIITHLLSKQICTLLHNQFWAVKICDDINLRTTERRRNCTGAGVLISFISTSAGTCKQVWFCNGVIALFAGNAAAQ